MPSIGLREVQDRPARCRSCNAPVKWAITAAGRPICLEAGAPITREGDELRVERDNVHFAHCPQADQHRREASDRRRQTEERAAAPRIAQLEADVERARELLERTKTHEGKRTADAIAALRRVLELAKTAKREDLLAEIALEIARLTGPKSDNVYPPSGRNRPRYSGD